MTVHPDFQPVDLPVAPRFAGTVVQVFADSPASRR
jgi:hypothetical protein